MTGLVEECLDGLSSTVQMNYHFDEESSRAWLAQPLTDASLESFGDCLAVGETEVNRAKESLRKILNAVAAHGRCPIDRFCVSGSLGHQPVHSSDILGFDLTMFVDCEASSVSLEKIYSSFQQVVPMSEIDEFGVHFEMDNFLFHLAVTPSLGHKMHLQRKHVWDLIEQRIKEGKGSSGLGKFSLALHESLTSFMHLGDPRFHGLVRLARLWREHVLVNSGCVEVSSLVVALVMIRCIEEENKARSMHVDRGLNVVHAFSATSVWVQFLTYMSTLDSIAMSWQRFYEPDLILERGMSGGTYIMNPVNPWHNILHGVSVEGMEMAKQRATNSLKKLAGPPCTIYGMFIENTVSTPRTKGA